MLVNRITTLKKQNNRMSYKLFKSVFWSWLKGTVILWLIISIIFYILSGNFSAFYAVGITIVAAGIPYLFIDYLKKRRNRNSS